MSSNKFHKTDVVVIVVFLILYAIGCAWLLKPKSQSVKEDDEVATYQTVISQPSVEQKKPKSLANDWPEELGRYFYWIYIEPGYEMEDEVFEVVGKSDDNYLVRRHNDWPDISGYFEWYCNERLTTTQQMFDYVVSHRNAILRQMQEVKRRGINRNFDEASYFQDHYDDYLDDPEDEIRFPPEIFEANEE